MDHIIGLYHGFQNHFLPANASAGLAGQNPTLLEAFYRLGAVDARIRAEKPPT